MKKIWFKNKTYGFGWTPCTWQGWVIMLFFIVLLTMNVLVLIPNDLTPVPVTSDIIWFFIREAILITALIYICYQTGEKPEWRWGRKIKDTREEIKDYRTKEEMADVLDDKGNKTGQTMTETEIHEKGIPHRTADVYILNDKGEIFLQKRSPSVIVFPNVFYLSAGGHLSAGETSEEAVVRETREEIGVVYAPRDLIHLGEAKDTQAFNDGKYVIHHFTDTYLIKDNLSREMIHIDHNEVSDFMWIPWREFESNIKNKDPLFLYGPGVALLLAYLHANYE